jgi:hypothetical protein
MLNFLIYEENFISFLSVWSCKNSQCKYILGHCGFAELSAKNVVQSDAANTETSSLDPDPGSTGPVNPDPGSSPF